MVIRIIFMRALFTIVAQSYLKIGRCDRQEGSGVLTAFQADGRFFKIQKKFLPKKFFENGNTQRRLHDGDLRSPFALISAERTQESRRGGHEE
jgi:hypothetical protein